MRSRSKSFVSMAAVSLASMTLWAGGCGPKTGVLESGSRPPAGPRVPAGASFEPRVGDFGTVETFLVDPKQMSDAAAAIVEVALPRIRSRGGLRDVWVLRSDSTSSIRIVSVWADPVQFQLWQMSADRLEAYQPLGPMLQAPVTAETASVIGLIDARAR